MFINSSIHFPLKPNKYLHKAHPLTHQTEGCVPLKPVSPQSSAPSVALFLLKCRYLFCWHILAACACGVALSHLFLIPQHGPLHTNNAPLCSTEILIESPADLTSCEAGLHLATPVFSYCILFPKPFRSHPSQGKTKLNPFSATINSNRPELKGSLKKIFNVVLKNFIELQVWVGRDD